MQIDISQKYAIALGGGGAKGAYQIGAWQALQEAGVQYEAVAGVSVGALNGALMTMRDLETAKRVWENITFSQVINVEDSQMKAFFDGDLHGKDWLEFFRNMIEVVRKGGFDTKPLENLLTQVVQEEKIRQSDVEFFLTTYSLSDHREIDLDVKTLPDGALHDMLLASAFFPMFRQKKIGGKYYADGGITNLIPLENLLVRGYRNIIILHISQVGFEKKVEIPEDARIFEIAPKGKLSSVLQFDGTHAKRDMQLGYFDAKRMLFGLMGERYYIQRTWSEEKAYGMLCTSLRKEATEMDKTIALRTLNEQMLPQLAKKYNVQGNYYDIWLRWVEDMANELQISPFGIRTEDMLMQEILQKKQKK